MCTVTAMARVPSPIILIVVALLGAPDAFGSALFDDIGRLLPAAHAAR